MNNTRLYRCSLSKQSSSVSEGGVLPPVLASFYTCTSEDKTNLLEITVSDLRTASLLCITTIG